MTDREKWTDDPAEADAPSDLIKRDPDETCNARCRNGTYCENVAGWGTENGHGRCKRHGAAGGGPTGEANGNYKHGLYSEEMSDSDEERAGRWIEMADGELSLDEFLDMLRKAMLYEGVRIERGMDKAPDPKTAEKHVCPRCSTPVPDPEGAVECPSDTCEEVFGAHVEPVLQSAWVDFGDRAMMNRIEAFAELVQTYKEVTEGEDVNFNGKLDVQFPDALRRAQEEFGHLDTGAGRDDTAAIPDDAGRNDAEAGRADTDSVPVEIMAARPADDDEDED